MVTYHPGILYVREQECEDPWLCFEAKSGPRTKTFELHFSRILKSALNWK